MDGKPYSPSRHKRLGTPKAPTTVSPLGLRGSATDAKRRSQFQLLRPSQHVLEATELALGGPDCAAQRLQWIGCVRHRIPEICRHKLDLSCGLLNGGAHDRSAGALGRVLKPVLGQRRHSRCEQLRLGAREARLGMRSGRKNPQRQIVRLVLVSNTLGRNHHAAVRPQRSRIRRERHAAGECAEKIVSPFKSREDSRSPDAYRPIRRAEQVILDQSLYRHSAPRVEARDIRRRDQQLVIRANRTPRIRQIAERVPTPDFSGHRDAVRIAHRGHGLALEPGPVHRRGAQHVPIIGSAEDVFAAHSAPFPHFPSLLRADSRSDAPHAILQLSQ